MSELLLRNDLQHQTRDPNRWADLEAVKSMKERQGTDFILRLVEEFKWSEIALAPLAGLCEEYARS